MRTSPTILVIWILLPLAMNAQGLQTGGRAEPSTAGTDMLALVDGYRGQGNYRKAEDVLRDLLATGNAGPEIQRIAQYNLADLLREEARTAEAGQLFTQLLGAAQETDELYLKALIGIAEVDLMQGNTQASISTCDKALLVARTRQDSTAEAIVLRNLGRAWMAAGSAARAEPLLRRSVSIAESTPNFEPTQVAASLSALGEYYLREKKPAKAQELWARVLSIEKVELGEDHPQVAYTKELLAAAYGLMGEKVLACDYARQSAGMMRALFGDDSIVAAAALGHLAVAEEQLRAFADAAEDYKSAIRVLRTSEMRDTTRLLMERYASVLKILHRNAELRVIQGDIKAFSSTGCKQCQP